MRTKLRIISLVSVSNMMPLSFQLSARVLIVKDLIKSKSLQYGHFRLFDVNVLFFILNTVCVRVDTAGH